MDGEIPVSVAMIWQRSAVPRVFADVANYIDSAIGKEEGAFLRIDNSILKEV